MKYVGEVFKPGNEPIDLAIGACGYESRSSFAARCGALSGRTQSAIAYKHRQTLSFPANLDVYNESRFEIHRVDDVEVERLVGDLVKSASKDSSLPIKVSLDVSSFDRRRLAIIFAALLNTCPARSSIELIYVPAKYSKPPNGEVILTDVSPIGPLFAGWTCEPEIPVVGVFGLGYEREKALGIIEYLELVAEESAAYIAVGEDERFYADCIKSNRLLLSQLEGRRVLNYRLDAPVSLVAQMESVLSGLRRRFRVVLVPLGPKLFTAVSMIVSARSGFELPVWRVSSLESEDPRDIVAAGSVVRMACIVEEDVEEKLELGSHAVSLA